MTRLLPILLCLTLCACSSTQKVRESLSPPDIVELHLLALPVAINLDPVPGADAFAVKVYAVSSRHSKTQPIRKGQLEILMYDGNVAGPELTNQPPLRVWSYSPPDLSVHLMETTFGSAYHFSPIWETNKPTQATITVLARYTQPKDEAPLYSAPSNITVVSQ